MKEDEADREKRRSSAEKHKTALDAEKKKEKKKNIDRRGIGLRGSPYPKLTIGEEEEALDESTRGLEARARSMVGDATSAAIDGEWRRGRQSAARGRCAMHGHRRALLVGLRPNIITMLLHAPQFFWHDFLAPRLRFGARLPERRVCGGDGISVC